jgi:hypothetical protein
MATKTRAKFAEPESSSEPANRNARALRYDSLASVLTNLDKQATVLPGKFKLDRISSADPTELAELRANVASMKAENQRLVESLTDELKPACRTRYRTGRSSASAMVAASTGPHIRRARTGCTNT